MNTKRQTIWLVSMLSLMVVLSAYYLFTDNVNELDLSADPAPAGTEIKVDAVTGGASESGADAADKGASAGQTDNGSSEKAADANAQKTDEEVLKQVSAKAVSGSDYFVAAQMKRTEELAKETERLIAITVDPKKSNEEVVQAQTELTKLQDLDEKVTRLEETLTKDYPNAVVLQDGGKWRVVVQAEKLEKSEGVSIIDQVTKELNITPDKVTVQYKR
jgi:stage III sporulation protein AH